MQASHKKTLKWRQKNVFTSYFNENKCDGASLLSLFDNVYCPKCFLGDDYFFALPLTVIWVVCLSFSLRNNNDWIVVLVVIHNVGEIDWSLELYGWGIGSDAQLAPSTDKFMRNSLVYGERTEFPSWKWKVLYHSLMVSNFELKNFHLGKPDFFKKELHTTSEQRCYDVVLTFWHRFNVNTTLF